MLARMNSKSARDASNMEDRRILQLRVQGVELDAPKEGSNLVVVATLYRLHDDKAIDKESFTSKSVKCATSGQTSFDSWVRILCLLRGRGLLLLSSLLLLLSAKKKKKNTRGVISVIL